MSLSFARFYESALHIEFICTFFSLTHSLLVFYVQNFYNNTSNKTVAADQFVRAFRITDYVIFMCTSFFFDYSVFHHIFCLLLMPIVVGFVLIIILNICFVCAFSLLLGFVVDILLHNFGIFFFVVVFIPLSIYCKIGVFFSLVTHLSYKDAIPIMAGYFFFRVLYSFVLHSFFYLHFHFHFIFCFVRYFYLISFLPFFFQLVIVFFFWLFFLKKNKKVNVLSVVRERKLLLCKKNKILNKNSKHYWIIQMMQQNAT